MTDRQGLDRTVALFVRALRNADVRVSPAETLDALAVVNHIGTGDKSLLRDALSMSLAKTRAEKQSFEETFERFFGKFAFQEPPKRSMLGSAGSDTVLDSLRNEVSKDLVEGVLKPILSGQRDALSLRTQEAANEAGLHNIGSLREKSGYADLLSDRIGLDELDRYIGTEIRSPEVRYLREYARTQIREFVDNQYRNHVDATGKRAIHDAATSGNLGHIPLAYQEAIREVVQKLAAKLVKKHRKKSLNQNRGRLDLKRTLRNNVAYDGNLFELKWQRKRSDADTVFVICDVSGSVAQVARFLLLFLYELVDILPKIRAFVFSSTLGEVTDVFTDKPSEQAIEETLFEWGKGNTDYGRALQDFRALCAADLSRRSTLIVFGDARSNYYDPGLSVFQDLSRRVKQVFWLNPEDRSTWEEGDSEMRRYAPHCTRVDLCSKLKDIERFADRLVERTR